MDWINGSLNLPLVPPPIENSFNFLLNPEMMKYSAMEKNISGYSGMSEMEKKKRLTNEQLESLEYSFMEEQKLEPERKMKLARELGLQPRQVAVWFQNRRARWKAKELERSYDALKLEFDVVFKETKRLQQEVLTLKMMIRERAGTNHQVSTGHTEIIESTLMENLSPPKWPPGKRRCDRSLQIVDQDQPAMYALNRDEYNPVVHDHMSTYWKTGLVSYP